MRRTPLVGAAACALALLLPGCGQPATPMPVVSPAPSSPPTASPAPAPPAAPPAPGPTAVDGAPYCGDAFVLSLVSGDVGWQGTPEQRLAMAQPRPTFEPADALAGLDVVCVATYRMPVDDEPGVAVIAQALLERDDDAFDALADWASEHYYESRTRSGSSFVEREAPPDPDGGSTRTIFWAPLDGDNPAIQDAAEIARLTGAAPDAILVRHADVTRE